MTPATDVRRAPLAHALNRAESRLAEAIYHAEQYPGDAADTQVNRRSTQLREAATALRDYDRRTAP